MSGQRYNLEWVRGSGGHSMIPAADGEWIRYEESAAPELVEALKVALPHLIRHHTEPGVYTAARRVEEALAKAGAK